MQHFELIDTAYMTLHTRRWVTLAVGLDFGPDRDLNTFKR